MSKTIASKSIALALISVLTGCGSSGPLPEVLATVPVVGTLTYQGKPVESFQVVFTPVDGSHRPATGRTDAAGKFTLGVNRSGDGAPVGSYKVSVAFDPVVEGDASSASPVDDPAKMPKPSVNVPQKYANPETSGLTQDVPKGGLKDLKLELQ